MFENSRIDQLSPENRTNAQALAADNDSAEGRLPVRSDRLWLFATLVGERDVCQCRLLGPASSTEPDPVTRIARDAGLHAAKQTRPVVRPNEQLHRIVISTDTPAFRELAETDDWSTITQREWGRIYQYPEDAVDSFAGRCYPWKALYETINTDSTLSATDVDYLQTLPYTPAPTRESIRTGIRRGKYFATLPQRIAFEYPFLDQLPHNCPCPLPKLNPNHPRTVESATER